MGGAASAVGICGIWSLVNNSTLTPISVMFFGGDMQFMAEKRQLFCHYLGGGGGLTMTDRMLVGSSLCCLHVLTCRLAAS